VKETVMPTESLFSGLKVVDCASYIAGPAATTVLADFGADVVKIEPPGIGDPYRFLYKTPPNPALDENYYWELTNRNKRGLCLDLKHPQASEVIRRLATWADVFVTNYPPKVRHGLKVAYEDLSPLNPRLIYADITGYGEAGPEADKPGFDLTAFWARSGLMEFTRNAGSPPTIPIPGSGDHATAITLYSAIVTALYRRERTGEGSSVSTSLIAEGAWMTGPWLHAALNGAQFELLDRRRSKNPLGAETYQTADGRWLILCLLSGDRDWPILAKAIRREDLLEDPRFATGKDRARHAELLITELDGTFASRPLSEWKSVLDAARLAYGVVQVPAEIVSDPQLFANGIVVQMAGEVTESRYTVSNPLTIRDAAKVAPRRAPRLGEHSHDVLRDLGFDPAEIAELQVSGAAPAPAPQAAAAE
jgi:formyl-CoA transferase